MNEGTKALIPVAGAALASFLEPMQCLAVTKLPEGEAWQYKLDYFSYGHRSLACPRASHIT
jgi:hypothetical protein